VRIILVKRAGFYVFHVSESGVRDNGIAAHASEAGHAVGFGMHDWFAQLLTPVGNHFG
jgi:hypothetical protein